MSAKCIDYNLVATSATPEAMAEANRKVNALKCNAAAIVCMSCMLENKRARSCIEIARAEGYPYGLAYCFERLDQKFLPRGDFKLSGLREQLRKLKFKDQDYPNDFFKKVAGIKNLAKKLKETDTISQSELVSHVINATPDKNTGCVQKVVDSAVMT